MKNHKLHRFGTVLVLTGLLICLLSTSAFAGSKAEWGYQHLDTNQRKVYDALEAVVVADGNRVESESSWGYVIDNTAPLDEVVRMFVADHPEYYWFTGSIGYSYYNAPGNALDRVVAAIVPTYTHNTTQERALFEEEVTNLLEKIPAGANDYEKALYIHDALVDNIVYDLNWQHEQSAYSAIVNGRAVCAGYARSYQYLLNRVGIDAWTVEGYAGEIANTPAELEPHAWNLVWFGDTCVYTDVTWDDQKTYLFHSYFNRCLDEIGNDHTSSIPDGYVYVKDASTYPHCITAEKYANGDYTLVPYNDFFTNKLPSCADSHEELTYYVQDDIVEIKGLSNDTYEILAEAVVEEEDEYCLLTFIYENYNESVFHNWLNLNKLADALPERLGSRILSATYIGFNGEVQVKLNLSEPDPYYGLEDHDGYIDTVTDGEITAYVSYAGTGLYASETYETVMVAYYSNNHVLKSVDFTQLKLDANHCGKITSDCPNAFDYCRIFVVGSEANPAPLCELLQLAAPQ